MTILSKISTVAPTSLDKEQTKLNTARLIEKIDELQKVLYASSQRGVLVILQGLDASGKDGLISTVFKGVNPLGCTVYAFKSPTEEELKYDFLWRVHKQVPAKGMIQIFNRSHYEDVLITRVEKWIDNKTAKKRFEYINEFERMLTENGTVILKFYLHISRETQAERLLERKTNPKKFWKHNDADWKTNQKWQLYRDAYHDLFKYCNKPEWTIVPSDQNWYKEYLVAQKIHGALTGMKLSYPEMK
jgi:PPK2 family polyphosphate:nucleotide phosphotransferase